MSDDRYKVESGKQIGGVTAGKIEIHAAEQTASALGALKYISEWLKVLRADGTEIPDDIREMVLQLREDFTDLRAQIADAADSNVGLQRQIGEMQALLDARANLAYRSGMYWEPGDIHAELVGSERNNGPFCPRCFDVDGRKVSLQRMDFTWNCPQRECGFVMQHSEPPDLEPRDYF